MNNTSSRADLHFFLLLLMLAGLYIFWTWNPEIAGLGGDNGVYLLTAQFYSPWSPPSLIAKHFADHSQYPPIYPLVLALLGGGDSILTAHLITTACLLLAFLAIRYWLVTLGLQKTTANLAVLLIALLPGTVKIAMFILSENLYLLLSVLGLLLAFLSERRESSFLLIMAAIAIAVAALTRTVGISLAAAFCLYLAIRRPARALLSGFATLAPLAVFTWYKSIHATEQSGYLDALISHYHYDTGAKILAQIQTESVSLWQGWFANFEPGFAGYLMGFCLILSFLALVVRIYKRQLDGFYLLFYFGVILLWPYPAEAKRLIYVVLPIMVGQSFSLINYIPALSVGQIIIRPVTLFILAMLVSSMPGTIVIAERFLQPLPQELEPYRRTKHLYSADLQVAHSNLLNAKILLEDMKSLNDKLPEDAIIYGLKPSIISLYAKRLALLPPSEITADNSLQDAGDRSRPIYFYMMGITSPSSPTPYYPFEKIKDRLDILHVARIHDGEDGPVLAILGRLNR